MVDYVNVHDAKSQLSALINKALKGEKVIIARNNEPLVELVSLKKEKRVPGQMVGDVKLLEKWQDADEDVQELFDQSEFLN